MGNRLKLATLTAATAVLFGTAMTARCGAEEIQTIVTIDRMLCLVPTDNNAFNNRDEVYIIVHSQAGDAKYTRRLPAPDDYYGFSKGTQGEVSGWTNQNNIKQGEPILWKGNLAPGQSVRILAVIGEQDNKDLKAIADTLLKIADLVIPFTPAAELEPVVAGMERMVSAIQDNHDDVIGSIGLALRNDNGKLHHAWPAGKFTKAVGDGSFECHGTSHSAYNLSAHVEYTSVKNGTPLPMRRVYLGTEIDQCGEPVLKVQDIHGSVAVGKGETKEVHVPSNRFWWYCASSQEWTTAPPKTSLVVVTRATDSRQITWKCYREE